MRTSSGLVRELKGLEWGGQRLVAPQIAHRKDRGMQRKSRKTDEGAVSSPQHWGIQSPKQCPEGKCQTFSRSPEDSLSSDAILLSEAALESHRNWMGVWKFQWMHHLAQHPQPPPHQCPEPDWEPALVNYPRHVRITQIHLWWFTPTSWVGLGKSPMTHLMNYRFLPSKDSSCLKPRADSTSGYLHSGRTTQDMGRVVAIFLGKFPGPSQENGVGGVFMLSAWGIAAYQLQVWLYWVLVWNAINCSGR